MHYYIIFSINQTKKCISKNVVKLIGQVKITTFYQVHLLEELMPRRYKCNLTQNHKVNFTTFLPTTYF